MKRNLKIKTLAVIFDMNGVVVDDELYHYKAWTIFCKKWKFKLNKQIYGKFFLGSTNSKIFPKLFGKISKAQIIKFEKEKESIYRKIYKGHVKLVPGLRRFLQNLDKSNIRFALATNSPKVNIDFIITQTKTAKYFKIILGAGHVRHGKPHPEIYLLAAKKLGVSPKVCVAFEDSYKGITSAQRAGMKVVGITTSHSATEIGYADLVIKDFTKMDLDKVRKII